MGWQKGNQTFLAENFNDQTGSQLLGSLTTHGMPLKSQLGVRLELGQWVNPHQGSSLSAYMPPDWVFHSSLDNIQTPQVAGMIGVNAAGNFLSIDRISARAERGIVRFEGLWKRRLQQRLTVLSAGLGFIKLKDELTLTAIGQDVDSTNNRFDQTQINTLNELVGLQAGVSHTRTWKRRRQLDVTLGVNAGVFMNISRQSMTENTNANPSGILSGELIQYRGDETNAATLLECKLNVAMPLGKRVIVMAGYHWMRVDGLAMAADQLLLLGSRDRFPSRTTNTNAGPNHAGEVTLSGGFAALQFTW